MSKRAMVRAAARRRVRRRGLGVAAALATAGAVAPPASAIEVNSLADPGNGNCGDGTCTLREAIDLADSTPATADTITFKSGLSGTVSLYPPDGQLTMYSPMTIQGPGANQVTVTGNTRLLYTQYADASISGLTLTSGNGAPDFVSSSGNGGAIYQYGGDLKLDRVVVSDNTSPLAGGIWSFDAKLTITNSMITGNASYHGGGVVSDGGVAGITDDSLVIRNSSITGNDGGDYGGGLLAKDVSKVELDHTTISGNRVVGTIYPELGGGVAITSGTGPVSIEDSTVAGNVAENRGGGVFLANGSGTTIENSTIAGNAAPVGGGVYRATSSGPTTVSSSIVADNAGSDLGSSGLVGSPVNLGFSLVESAGATPIQQSPVGSNLLGSDPQLGPLADNGGPTQTMLIAPASPALNAGVANGLATDQRGLARSSGPPGANGSDGTDIGAVELQGSSDSTGPNVNAKAKGKTKAGKPLKIVVSSDEAASIDAAATAKAGKKKVTFKAASGDVSAGGSVTLKLKLSKRAAKLLKRAGKGKANVTVTATDSAGNKTTDPLKVKLK